jgi:hypothetical protein
MQVNGSEVIWNKLFSEKIYSISPDASLAIIYVGKQFHIIKVLDEYVENPPKTTIDLNHFTKKRQAPDPNSCEYIWFSKHFLIIRSSKDDDFNIVRISDGSLVC